MPNVDNPNAFANSSGGLLRKQAKRIDDLKSKTRAAFNSLTVGAGGLIVSGVTQLVGGITGGLAVTGALSATTTISAGGGNSQLDSAGNLSMNGTVYSVYALNNAVTTGYFALYVNSDGRFGRTVSARRYKQDVQDFSPSLQAVFALQLREYRLKQAVEEMGEDAPVEHGLIAEELVECGLGWLVQFGPDGQAEAIAYEKVALALIPVIQDHERRLLALEG